MNNVIITGFEPFGPYQFNPTKESTTYFNGRKIGESHVRGIILPCTYYGAFEKLKQAIDELKPSLILSTGLSSSVKGIRFETTAKNLMNGKYPDATGYFPVNRPILNEGRESIPTNSPNQKLMNILLENHIPAELSNDADSFICNSLMYLTSHYLQQKSTNTKNVFIHIPWTDEYAQKITLEPEKIMIQKEVLFHAIDLIVTNVSKSAREYYE